MAIWSDEINEIKGLHESISGQLPELESELQSVISSDDEKMVLIYSRRCLEVIITDLCERELNRPRKTDPLKGIIDKLKKENRIPSHIYTAMDHLNSLSTYGAHPKEFDPRQVKPAIINLTTIVEWYLTYTGIDRDAAIDKELREAQAEPYLPGKTRKAFIPRKLRKYIWPVLVTGNLLLIYLIINSWNRVPFSERDWIILTDFENLTGDSIFDHTLNTALEISLQQSPYVNVYPRKRMQETLERMKMEKSIPVNESMGIEIAQREGVKLIVVCSVSQLGSIYTLSSEIIEAKSGETLRSESFQANTKEEVLKSLDKLGRKLRRDLGESIKSINYEIVPLPEATTSSLDALDYLVKGFDAWTNDGNIDEAENLLLEAVKLDPNFALAHAYLGSLYYWNNDRLNGEEHFTGALALLDRLTEKEKLLIEARVERFRGNHDGAVIKYGTYLRKYPDSPSEWFSLGYSYMRLQRYEESIDAFNRSLEIFGDEEPNAFINMAGCFRGLGNYQKSIDYRLKAYELNPALLTVNNLNHEFGFTYVEMGEYEKALEVFEKMDSGDDGSRAGGLRSRALLLMYHGNFQDAIRLLNESTLIFKTIGYRVSEFRNRMFLAVTYRSAGMTKEFQEELGRVKELTETTHLSPGWLLYYGKLLARMGNVQEAENILDTLHTRINEGNKIDRASFNILKGEIELAKGNLKEVEDLFKTAIEIQKDSYNLESLANYYHVTGNHEMAISNYQEIIDRNILGWEAQPHYLEAHLRLGKIFEAEGDTAQALKYYRQFLDIWKDADEGLPDLVDAQSSLSRLSG
jgi:tetratricopeptide (TPR) repeat protein